MFQSNKLSSCTLPAISVKGGSGGGDGDGSAQ